MIRRALLLACLAACSATDPDDDSDSTVAADVTTLRTVDRRFEIVPLDCTPEEALAAPQCPAGAARCMCSDLFERLNTQAGSPGNPEGKVIATLGGGRRSDIEGKGNVAAYLVLALNRCDGHPKTGDAYPAWHYCSGKERAQQIMDLANASWGGKPPKWFLLNEVFHYFRLDTQIGAEYRHWLEEVVRSLHVDHGRHLVLFTYMQPHDTQWKATWSALGEHANIGVEMYLSGSEMQAYARPIDGAKAAYQRWRQDFVDNGVPASKVWLTEHFGQTTSDKGFGRTELSDRDWRSVLHERTRAEQAADFAGYISYGWEINNSGAIEGNRLDYEGIYDGYRLQGKPLTVEIPE